MWVWSLLTSNGLRQCILFKAFTYDPKGQIWEHSKAWQQSESTHLGCKTTKQTKCIYERNVGQQGLKQPHDFKGTTSRYSSVEMLHVTNCDKCDLRCVIMTVCEFKGWIFFSYVNNWFINIYIMNYFCMNAVQQRAKLHSTNDYNYGRGILVILDRF